MFDIIMGILIVYIWIRLDKFSGNYKGDGKDMFGNPM